MPNHCHNRVRFYCEDSTVILKLHAIFSKALAENDDTKEIRETVFGHFIPEPDWTKVPLSEENLQRYSFSNPRGEVGECSTMVKHENPFYAGLRFPSTGESDDRWYDWRCQNWDTKWDCYDVEIDDDYMPNEFEVTFNTAWSPPEAICHAIREQFDGLDVQWFYDEPGAEIAGYL
jgi:hypothetical protein